MVLFRPESARRLVQTRLGSCRPEASSGPKPSSKWTCGTDRGDAVGKRGFDRAPIIGEECRRTALGHQPAKQLEIAQLRTAGTLAADREQRVADMTV